VLDELISRKIIALDSPLNPLNAATDATFAHEGS